MLWVTTKKLRIARAATVWLIRRFIDPSATFRFVAEPEVVELERSEGREIGFRFHAKGACYSKLDDRRRVTYRQRQSGPGSGGRAGPGAAAERARERRSRVRVNRRLRPSLLVGRALARVAAPRRRARPCRPPSPSPLNGNARRQALKLSLASRTAPSTLAGDPPP